MPCVEKTFEILFGIKMTVPAIAVKLFEHSVEKIAVIQQFSTRDGNNHRVFVCRFTQLVYITGFAAARGALQKEYIICGGKNRSVVNAVAVFIEDGAVYV